MRLTEKVRKRNTEIEKKEERMEKREKRKRREKMEVEMNKKYERKK